MPAIGMGTWITFNVGGSVALRNARTEVLRAFFEAGGTFIDSSPMYGSSEEVIGYALGKTGSEQTFTATKTWTGSTTEARQQLSDSQRLWGRNQFDLLQVHNLVGWREHLPWFKELKHAGIIRYVGVTTSHGRRHDEIEQILKTQSLDFVQLTYNLIDTDAQRRLIPLARDKGIAVICNRPFRGGGLTKHTERKKVPNWADELQCQTWPQLMLKFIISMPGVTVAIPATSQVAHMKENMQAMYGVLPDEKQRNEIRQAFSNL
ncbi:aldo/keto reductase [Planctobacterium marinum]|uniref:Oxidoreductase n=1 Tax=Planctobacterium marinum TaxID=1631968 RepID=A0AA48HQW0_9ALTE|nr:oxidoreductase [Planctobacterium marinum]